MNVCMGTILKFHKYIGRSWKIFQWWALYEGVVIRFAAQMPELTKHNSTAEVLLLQIASVCLVSCLDLPHSCVCVCVRARAFSLLFFFQVAELHKLFMFSAPFKRFRVAAVVYPGDNTGATTSGHDW